MLAEKDVQLTTIIELLGHVNIVNTQIYCKPL